MSEIVNQINLSSLKMCTADSGQDIRPVIQYLIKGGWKFW